MSMIRAAPTVKAIAFTALIALVALEPPRAEDSVPAAYDARRIVELEGSILALRWIEPRVELSMLARDGRVWDIESSSIGDLQRAQVFRETLGVGTEIVIAGFPARNGMRLYATNLLLPGRTEIVLHAGTKRRWNERRR